MPTGDLPDWRQVYADDFSGTQLNTRNAWSVYGNGVVSSNPTTAYWSPGHVSVGDSMLTINGSQDPSVSPDGRVVTAGLGLWKLPKQTYGKYEMLVRMDACPEVKYAWLLWPYDGQWPQHGEIDFAEDEGGSRTKSTASMLYKNALGKADALPKSYVTPTPSFASWHVVGVEWTPGGINYTLDGKSWGTISSDLVPSTAMTFVVQTESKVLPGLVPSTFTSCNAQIGWVVQYAMK
jgi:beta-glucanase (GH16 family)